MSRAAAASSQRLGEHLANLGLSSLDDKLVLLPSDDSLLFGNTSQAVTEWIRTGARREDDTFLDTFARYRNHFFDPRPEAPNSGGFTGFLGTLGLFNGLPAPDWALEPTPIPTQLFGFKDARASFLRALTKSAKADRDSSLALTFRTIGQVIHVLQDMAQPQHTRNDGHLLPSLFEKYSDKGSVRSQQSLFSGGSVPQFNNSRDFFTNDQATGLAQYTNRAFVSQETNFRWDGITVRPNATYTSPAPLPNPEVASVQTLDVPQAVKSYCADTVCNMRLYTSQSDQGEVQPRAATLSIFADDLDLFHIDSPNIDPGMRFSLNTVNFQAVLPTLVPLAIGYSAGMINYFFRGKIDYVPDPAPGGQFVVKNLGTEPMKGKFQVYYDDQSGTRHQMTDYVWDTEVILAGATQPGVLGPGEGMPVPRIVAPQLPQPKTPDEYILVFSGAMGEETPDENGSVGAVVSKFIKGTPYGGELYVAGLDAQNRVVTFKVDPAGLRVLNGFDANGQFHSTPSFWSSATQKDIDPLLPVVNALPPGTVQTKVQRMKQAVFESGVLGGMSHQIAAVSFPLSLNNFLAYVRDPATGRLTPKGSAIRWTARSPDPSLGDFEFWSESRGTLSYTRTFRPAPDQNPVTTGGSVAIQASSDLVSLVSDGFRGGSVVVSPDGLTVSGFKGQSQSDPSDPFTSYWDTYDLKLTLAAQPSASVVQTEHVLQVPLNFGSPDNISESTQTGPIGPYYDSTYTNHSKLINDGERIDNDRRTFEDYIAGNLVTWRAQTQGTQVIEIFNDGSSHEVWSQPTGCPLTITQDRQFVVQATTRNIYTVTVQLDQVITNVTKNIGKGGGPSLFGNYTRTNSFHEVDILTCDTGGATGPSPLIPGTPVIHDDYVFAPDAVDTPVVTGFSLIRALNGKVDGSILFDQVARGFVLRGQSLGQTSGGFIADSSPLGEIFAAKTDKSTIVYTPAPSSRMPPTIDIPANIVRLIAAVWL